MNALPFPLSEEARRDFQRCVTRVVARGIFQLGQPPLTEGELEKLGSLLVELGREGGWQARFGGGREEMPAGRVIAWVGRITALVPDRAGEFAGLAKQLIKTCFQPAPAKCRDSYRECDASGRCRRQERVYVLARISGAHCVDCPHWESSDAHEHSAWLGAQWRAGANDLANHREVYLPEDFRALRCWTPSVNPM